MVTVLKETTLQQLVFRSVPEENSRHGGGRDGQGGGDGQFFGDGDGDG